MIHQQQLTKGGAPTGGSVFFSMTLTPEQTERLFMKLGEMHGDLKSLTVELQKTTADVHSVDERVSRLELSKARGLGYLAGAAAVASCVGAGAALVFNLYF